jgi:hypothetical protein
VIYIPEIEINFLAVLVASVVSMVVGFLWYSPFLFAKPWMKLSGMTKDKMAKANMTKTYGVSFVVAIVTAYVLAHVMGLSMNFYNYSGLMTGLSSAFWMWLGFVMPVQLTGWLFDGKALNLFLINTGYQLASLLAMGVVLGLWM